MRSKKVENTNIFLTLYSYANNEIELLRDYYRITYKNVVSHRLSVEKEYEPGYKINELIESIVDKKNNTINEQALDVANNTVIMGDATFKDIVTNISIKEDSKKIVFTFAPKYKAKKQFNPNIARFKYKETQRYESIFSRSIVSDIIVTFESLLTKIFNILILRNPFPYLEGETIPLANYFIKDTQKNVAEKIEKVVEKKMYDSISTLEQILQIEKIDIDKDILISFKEIYYRRNIIIHNDSVVNNQYLNSIHTNIRKNIKIGETLICDTIYVNNALNVVQELFFFLFYGIFKKYQPDTNYLNIISNFAFRKLQEKEYNVAKIIYKKISTNNEIEFIEKMMYRINYLNAVKQLGETQIFTEEIKGLDVSIATENFKIAKLCLLDENKEIYELLNKTYPTSFGAIELKEWPIFINFRETEEYRKFCSEHSEDFLNEEIKGEDEN